MHIGNRTPNRLAQVLFTVVMAAGAVPSAQGEPAPGPVNDRQHGYEGFQVINVTVTNEAQIEYLKDLDAASRDVEIWSDGVGIGPVTMRIPLDQKALLDANGLAYEVLVEDLQKHLDDRFAGPRDPDFFDSLRTYDEHVQFMTDLATAYPDLAEMVTLGTSVEDRILYALRITGPGDDKPGVMYHGAQHGNEAASASAVAYTAHHLLTNYQSDPEIATLVDGVDWFLLPIMNPDGYVRHSRYNANGVDLNRNWGGPGCAANPFSQPETAAMRDFFLAHPHVRMHIDLHGYVNWIMWPWGHTYDLCPDHWTFHALGSQVQDLIAAAGGGYYEIGTGCQVSYPVSGGSMAYSYGVLGLWVFTFELRDADLPEICEEFLSSMLLLAEWISDCNDNTIPDLDEIAAGTSADCNGNDVPDECESLADVNGDGRVDLADYRIYYHCLTGPGDHTPPDGCTRSQFAIADLDRDNDIDIVDLALFAAHFEP